MTAQPDDTVVHGPWGPGPLARRPNRLDRPADDAQATVPYSWRVWRIAPHPPYVSDQVSTHDRIDGGSELVAEPAVASTEAEEPASAAPFGVRPRIWDAAA